MSKGSVIVIGGGVVGLCSAYYLQQTGYEVTVLEKGRLGEGTSFGNAGMIVPSHFVPLAQPGMIAKGMKWMFDSESPFYVKPRLSFDLFKWGWQFYQHANDRHVTSSAEVLANLNLLSKQCYLELTRDLKGFNVNQRGLVMYCKTQHALDEEAEIAERAHQIGMKAEVMTSNQLRELDANITLNVFGGVYFPQDAFLTPATFMNTMQDVLKKKGVTLIERASIDQFEINHDQVIACHAGERRYPADQFVIAAGSWSAQLSKQLGINLNMQAGKGYSMTLSDPVEMPAICSILTEAKVAVTPMNDGLRFAGTMEIGGLDLSINHKRVMGIKKSIPEYFPAFKVPDFDELEIWSGLRPCAADGLPYIGRAPKYSNLIVATGHGMMGMSMGPATGLLVKEVAENSTTSIEISKFALKR
ncbi:MAG: FAD-dependent oxidoreductase [Cyclobacteriaceae bacterium]